MERELNIGDIVIDSGVGPGKITGFSERGMPQVNEITCAWVIVEGNLLYDPFGVSAKHIAARRAKEAAPPSISLTEASNDPVY